MRLKLVMLLGLSLTINALIFPATDTRIYHTEHNWYADPSGYLENVNSGAYLKVRFNGSSFKLNLDDSFNQKNCTLAWSVDDGPEQNLTLPSASKTITIASDLRKRHHSFSLLLYKILFLSRPLVQFNHSTENNERGHRR